MFIKSIAAAVCALSLAMSGAAQATPVSLFASSVINFSSQYSTGNWSAAQVLGSPNTLLYGDHVTAWAPGPSNGTLEFITVGFGNAVYASGAMIRETYGNGFVYQIDALDTLGALHTVWSGVDSSLPNAPVDFTVSWARTSYLVRGLKVYTNTNHNLSTWEEIDAIRLDGDTQRSAVPEPATVALMGLGLLGFAAARRRSAKQ